MCVCVCVCVWRQVGKSVRAGTEKKEQKKKKGGGGGGEGGALEGKWGMPRHDVLVGHVPTGTALSGFRTQSAETFSDLWECLMCLENRIAEPERCQWRWALLGLFWHYRRSHLNQKGVNGVVHSSPVLTGAALDLLLENNTAAVY